MLLTLVPVLWSCRLLLKQTCKRFGLAETGCSALRSVLALSWLQLPCYPPPTCQEVHLLHLQRQGVCVLLPPGHHLDQYTRVSLEWFSSTCTELPLHCLGNLLNSLWKCKNGFPVCRCSHLPWSSHCKCGVWPFFGMWTAIVCLSVKPCVPKESLNSYKTSQRQRAKEEAEQDMLFVLCLFMTLWTWKLHIIQPCLDVLFLVF